MAQKYIYQRSGGPLITWTGRNSAPMQSRAADTVALGSLGDPTLVLPAPGAPEPLNGISCKCGGSCGCSGASPMSGITDTLAANPLLTAVGAYLAYRWWKKRKR